MNKQNDKKKTNIKNVFHILKYIIYFCVQLSKIIFNEIIERMRFSISSKLKLMYFFRIVVLLISVNIIYTVSYVGFLFFNADRTLSNNCNIYAEYIEKNKLDGKSKLSSNVKNELELLRSEKDIFVVISKKLEEDSDESVADKILKDSDESIVNETSKNNLESIVNDTQKDSVVSDENDIKYYSIMDIAKNTFGDVFYNTSSLSELESTGELKFSPIKIFSQELYIEFIGLRNSNSNTNINSNDIKSVRDTIIFLRKNQVININGNDILNLIDYLIIISMVLVVLQLIQIMISLGKSTRKTKKILQPIKDMDETINNITANSISTRINISGSQNELKDLSKTFNQMLDRIENSFEIQKQFVSDASHELRTPLAVIQGYSKMLKRWGKDDRAILEESIDAIESESESMKNLIDQLLFLARGDKNTQSFSKEKFKMNKLIDNVVKQFLIIDEGCHIIEVDINEEFEIEADINLMKECLRIFVDNSIKYTKEGGKITISSYLVENKLQSTKHIADDKLQSTKMATIVIKDNGIGISKEDIPKIFDRFFRADKSRTRKTGGTGLGLSIAKWIVDKHQGTIDVSSKIDVGTIFLIKIPQ
ncbi:MAG: HAMP domain-containing histidine kinase [Clostridioides sp.]|nr:HAMP domain-containing histidine kinase [Clostridioides sp.]